MNDYRLSGEGLQLLKQSEGLRLKPYLDANNRLTVGFGHKLLPNEAVAPGGINEQQALAFLEADVEHAEATVRRLVKVQLTQGMFDALVDYIFNEGEGHFGSSTLLRKINEAHFDDAAHEFGRWVYAGGKIMPGLVVRREAERVLFTSHP